ncbi:hypothetical protein ABIF68_002294 [Bradyrhizobium japonicum]
MPSTFSLHKIDEAIRDLEEKVAHGAEISREGLASELASRSRASAKAIDLF